MYEVELAQGTVRYTDTDPGGSAGADRPVVVLVHGLLVNGTLWRDVVPGLAEHARVVVPELPLGSHRVPMRADADLSPPGIARLIADFMAALDLREVTLVGNDTGGAMCQLVATRHPERLARLVLTNCDTHKNFLPMAFKPMQWVAWVPGALWLIAQAFRIRPLLASPVGFGVLASTPVGQERLDGWVAPALSDRRARRDLAKVLRGIRVRYTLQAARDMVRFGRPILLAWGRKDRFFTPAHAQRLVDEWRDVRLEWVESATFVPVDAPEQLSELVAHFMREASASR
ncbi:alpha/beta fold hydrolase [Pseudonocardia acaciae]|uniref:alpha/beta fold hydrolase n=1 Tax=Pseudonocardia acaciae TaxID=551276 RepID=UPI000566D0F9|nr:alpha/beta fold hydrolase [Pseudonocardia acaciae]